MGELALLDESSEQYLAICKRYPAAFQRSENLIVDVYFQVLHKYIQEDMRAFAEALLWFLRDFNAESIERFSKWDFTELRAFLAKKPDSVAKTALDLITRFGGGEVDRAQLSAIHSELVA
jgi:hypothetical protein